MGPFAEYNNVPLEKLTNRLEWSDKNGNLVISVGIAASSNNNTMLNTSKLGIGGKGITVQANNSLGPNTPPNNRT